MSKLGTPLSLVLILIALAPFTSAALGILEPGDAYFKASTPFNLSFVVINGAGAFCTGLDTDCYIEVYNTTGGLIAHANLTYSADYNQFQLELPGYSGFGIYAYQLNCNSTTENGVFPHSYELTRDGNPWPVQSLGIGLLILIPIFFACACIWGGATLDDKHWPLKIFLFILGFISPFTSINIGLNEAIKFYYFPELENTLASTAWWFGIALYVILAYIALFLMYSLAKSIYNKKKEGKNY